MTPEEENEIVRNLKRVMPNLEESVIRETLRANANIDFQIESFPMVMQALIQNIKKKS